ncbi:MAG: AAA family ATPase [Anaerolineales bacterium]|nr:AAA family ATPase [Anaerolineales bacterium]
MHPVFAHCLGRFQVTLTHPGRPNPTPIHFATDRVAALLAFLLNQPNEAHRREYLAYLIWPERPDALARQNLRQTLSRLRRAFKPYEIIESDYQTVRLNTAVVNSDLAEFRHSLTQNNLTHAADLYQGDFLHGFSLPENPAFGEWLLLTRDAWQRQARDVLAALIEQHQNAGHWGQVITCAQRYIQLEPWDEEMHRTLLAAWAHNNERAEAINHYQTYVADLQAELGISPEAETVQLAKQVAHDKPVPGAEQAVWHGFPLDQTPFVGRTAESVAIRTYLTQQPGQLVTITGAGGMGKTRLACHAAQTLDPAQFSDGIYFVPCTAVEDPADFLPHLINQLGLELDGSRPMCQQLEQFLARRPHLLILLDNFEQLSAHAANLLAPLRHSQTTLLVTSRHALNLQGEQRYSLRGLLQDSEGEALFMARARRYEYTDFTPAERALIRQLVQLVAGMPLAIEIAAAWLRAYDLPTLLQFLQDNMSLWVAPQADVPARHQSLEAVFNGSWQLLSPALQSVLGRLSLLQGTFTPEAAQRIAGASFFDLAQLIDRSLLAVERSGRYHSHPLLRQLAQDKLAEMGAEAADTAVRHAHYYLALLQQAGQPLRGIQSQTAVRRIRLEYDNMRAAWLWASRNGQTALLAEAAQALADYFLLTGLYEEGADLLAKTAPLLSAELWLERRDYTAVVRLVAPLLPQLTDELALLKAYALLGLVYYYQGQLEQAGTAVGQGLPIAAQHPHACETAYFYVSATLYSVAKGDPSAARGYVQQALAILYTADDLWGASKALYANAVVDGVMNQNARPNFLQIAHIQKQLGSASLQQMALHNLAVGSMLQGDYPQARALCEEAWLLCQRLNHALLMADNRLVWGRIHYRIGAYAEATSAYAEALAVWEAQAMPQPLSMGLIYSALLANARGQTAQALDDCHHARLWSERVQNPLVSALVDWCLARVHLGVGAWSLAQKHGDTAVETFARLRLPGRLMDARAIVAYAQWRQGNTAVALAQVDEILTYRASVNLLKSDDPFYLEWCCYQVLHGAGQEADALWQETHQRLQKQIHHLDEANIPHGMTQVPHHAPFLSEPQ